MVSVLLQLGIGCHWLRQYRNRALAQPVAPTVLAVTTCEVCVVTDPSSPASGCRSSLDAPSVPDHVQLVPRRGRPDDEALTSPLR